MQYLQTNTMEQLADVLPYNFSIEGLKNDNLRDYELFKLGSTEGFTKKKLQKMQVLDSLYRLGFPVNDGGTYLYQAMIVKALHLLDGTDSINVEITEDSLEKLMQAPYSQFYLDTAKYDLDIGIKTFHAYIKQALKGVDYARVDPNVLSEIYGNFDEEADYGKHAFVIAKHIHDRSKDVQVEATDTKGYQYVKSMVTVTE